MYPLALFWSSLSPLQPGVRFPKSDRPGLSSGVFGQVVQVSGLLKSWGTENTHCDMCAFIMAGRDGNGYSTSILSSCLLGLFCTMKEATGPSQNRLIADVNRCVGLTGRSERCFLYKKIWVSGSYLLKQMLWVQLTLFLFHF